MIKYILRKLLALIPKLLVISFILFMAMELLPGDPLTRSIPPDHYAEMTEAQRDLYRETLGLNDPVLVRYVRWLGGVLHGDLGYSTSSKQNIGEMLAGRLPYTMELSMMGLIVAGVLGVLLGYIAALHKGKFIDRLCTTTSILGVSVPGFFFGIVFLLIFAVKLKWFPTGGRMGVGEGSDFFSRFKYMVLPVMTMAITLIPALVSYTRNSVLDVLNKDYIKTARSKGLPEHTVNLKHAFRNALIPVMTILCLRIPMLVGGSVVVETVFNYTGVGSMGLNALSAGDIPIVMNTTMVTAAFTLIASTLVDIVTGMLDPRIRLE